MLPRVGLKEPFAWGKVCTSGHCQGLSCTPCCRGWDLKNPIRLRTVCGIIRGQMGNWPMASNCSLSITTGLDSNENQQAVAINFQGLFSASNAAERQTPARGGLECSPCIWKKCEWAGSSCIATEGGCGMESIADAAMCYVSSSSHLPIESFWAVAPTQNGSDGSPLVLSYAPHSYSVGTEKGATFVFREELQPGGASMWVIFQKDECRLHSPLPVLLEREVGSWHSCSLPKMKLNGLGGRSQDS